MGRINVFSTIDTPANAKVLLALQGNAPQAPMELDAETADTWQLGAHPDLVEYLWNTLGSQLPHPCARVAFSQPVLAHIKTGTIFAYVGGTGTLAMRLPTQQLQESRAVDGFGETISYPSGVLRASDFGPNWSFVKPFGDTAHDWCLTAYGFAGDAAS